MSYFPRSLLTTAISAALFAQCSYAAENNTDNVDTTVPDFEQCTVNEKESQTPNEQPVNVEADQLEAINGDKATYSGNVIVTQGKKHMKADNVTLHQKENVVVAEGNVNFSDGQVKATSDKATNNLNTNEITLQNTRYKFLCEPGRGDAAYISKTGKAVYKIKDGSITSCPEGDNAWRLKASSIKIDKNEEKATFYNPRMEVLGVPFLYLPMLTVPIGDTRKTGFLYPTFSYGSNDGFEFNAPIYWNLAPNYDLQTDIKYMEARGTQLNSKFRYLTDIGSGTIFSEYLPDDRKYTDKGGRWGFQVLHHGIYHENWAFNVNYAKVSDVDYFTDIDSNIGNKEDGQLIQQAELSYRTQDWDLTLLTRDFQILTTSSNQPYRVLPQIAFNYYAPEMLPYVDFDVVSHLSRFETDNNNSPDATRIHLEPGLTIPLGASWGDWTSEARLLTTYYQQDLKNMSNSEGRKKRVSRVIPEFRSHMGLILENDTPLMNGYSQTLEPQVQYLYVPKKNQSEIASYDTTLSQVDYYGLFRSRKNSSIDYVAPANQVSYGATTRFFDKNYKERFNLSFGQIFYLDGSTKQNQYSAEDNRTNYSPWAIETDFNFNDAVFYHGGLQYDVDTDKMQLANSTIEYRRNTDFIQANYRYISKDYIKNTLSDSSLDIDSLTDDGISQMGLVGQYTINPNWQVNGHYYYDLTTDQAIEWEGRLTYRSDCWYIGLGYSRELDKWAPDFSDYPNANPVYENNFSLNFGIIGFGTNVGAGNDSNSGSLDYGRPFFLNN